MSQNKTLLKLIDTLLFKNYNLICTLNAFQSYQNFHLSSNEFIKKIHSTFLKRKKKKLNEIFCLFWQHKEKELSLKQEQIVTLVPHSAARCHIGP